MANEITYSYSIGVSKSNLINSKSASGSITMNGSHYASGAMNIPTTAGGTAIPLGSVATNGTACFKNLDATNYVEIGVQVTGTFYPLIRLKPGEPAYLRISPSAVPYALANTAAVALEYLIYED